MLFLNKQDIQGIDRSTIQNGVKKAYQHVLDDNYNMPDRIHVANQENMLLLMPCFSEKYFATKLVSVFPDAPTLGQPAVNGVLVLCDNTTGRPLALMDGAAITAERTGAVGGLGVACLTEANVQTAGIIGAGVQGMSQARYLLLNRDIDALWIHDIIEENADNLANTLKREYPGLECTVSTDPLDLVFNSQVIISATTSKTPVFNIPSDKADDLIKGKVFISIGSFRPDMKEFPDEIIRSADKVFVDTLFAAQESGDIAIPLNQNIVEKDKIEQFATLIEPDGQTDLMEKTLFFKSVGMALFDLAVASSVYELALSQDLGGQLDL